MFGGSYFGESPFASPLSAVRRRVKKWLAGPVTALWSAATRANWNASTPQEATDTGVDENWEADTPTDGWETGSIDP